MRLTTVLSFHKRGYVYLFMFVSVIVTHQFKPGYSLKDKLNRTEPSHIYIKIRFIVLKIHLNF